MTITAGAAAFRQAIADRYAIVRELGEGGMATVFLARDLKHGRDVAIKVLKPEVGQTLGAERFLREIQVAARLCHPHILPEHRAMLTEIALPGVAATSPG